MIEIILTILSLCLIYYLGYLLGVDVTRQRQRYEYKAQEQTGATFPAEPFEYDVYTNMNTGERWMNIDGVWVSMGKI